MSGLDDYPDEMPEPRTLDERTIEAIFTGRTVPDDDALLAEFTQSIRAFTQQPVPAPQGDLAELLVNGLTIDKGDLLVTAASNVTGPRREVSGPPKWRKPGMIASGALSTLMTKFTALGLAAKTGVAVAVTVAGVTAAGATGALPGPAQNAIADAVNAVTPLSFPTQASSHAAFGAQTSTAAAGNHGVNGASVSSAAKQRGATTTTTTDTTTTTTNPGPPSAPGSQSAAGLSRANATPAAGHVPISVPTPANPGSQSGTTSGSQSGGPPGSQSGTTPGSQSGTTPGSQSGGTPGSQSGGTPGAGARP